MARGRRTGWSAIVMGVTSLSLTACGLVGGSSDAAGGSDWTVTPQTTPTSTTLPAVSTVPKETRSPTVRLTDEDRRVISVCQAVTEVQSAGMAFWEAFDSESGGLSASAARVGTALTRLADVSDDGTRAEIGPVLAELARVTGSPDPASMRQVAAQVIQGVGSRITNVLSGLQPLCPGQLKPEDLDQAERVDLAEPPPTD